MAACVLLFAGCAADDGGPRLAAVAPAAAGHSATVMLTGTRLCGGTGDCTQVGATIVIGLELPSLDATIAAYAPTAATIVVPEAAPIGRTSLVLTVNGQSSNALDFEVTP